ncbi:tetratricopeptide repeat protein [[Limnothrix rosea] IAM M-220]|uniref:tetratricopeptide repeat protein n=1 Tax=[Limnothrix rosea] IAM M-220 TaxID=454133 RepID=UPI0009673DF7|nr:tetratricopeptide repeat protein [[Limnothrix rosea] IAM M-220]OKH17571.1 hypothetical protein NIES208_08650 [[Limnothrix rosea] IAM M-220]
MGASSIGEAIYNYQNALQLFIAQPNQQHLLETLYARDRLAYLLRENSPISVGYQDQLTHLDQEFKQQANLIVETLDLAPTRESCSPSPEAWWWFPEKFLQPHEQDKLDWAWRSGTLVGWTVNLALLTDITTKFISGGIGLGGAGAIILPSLLTLVKARGDLTDVGQNSLRSLFTKIGIKSQWREEATMVSTWALFFVIFGLWASLPQISKLYNYLGHQAAQSGDLPTAEANYKRAIALKEDNMQAHYNLGNLYEDLRDVEAAKAQYEIVANAEPANADNNVALAQNNLARLFILEEDYSSAASLLTEVKNNLQYVPEDVQEETGLVYSFNKNLGWARYKQELYDQADLYLTAAEEIRPDGAAAHCLQAQNFAAKDETTQAIAAWEKCRDLADPAQPDQDNWLVMAIKALDAAEAGN